MAVSEGLSMSEISSSVDWTQNLEHYFATTGERANGLSWCHKQAEAVCSVYRDRLGLPVIILGVLNGATSIGSNSLFPDPKFASVGVGLIALLTAILSAISSYFRLAQRAEAHRISSLQYSKLYRFLSVQMGLPRESRMTPADLLRHVKDSIDHLAEISPLLPPSVVKQFRRQFDTPQYVDVARPSECNGLERIEVYQEPAPLTLAPAKAEGFRPAVLPDGGLNRADSLPAPPLDGLHATAASTAPQ